MSVLCSCSVVTRLLWGSGALAFLVCVAQSGMRHFTKKLGPEEARSRGKVSAATSDFLKVSLQVEFLSTSVGYLRVLFGAGNAKRCLQTDKIPSPRLANYSMLRYHQLPTVIRTWGTGGSAANSSSCQKADCFVSRQSPLQRNLDVVKLVISGSIFGIYVS